MKKHKRKYVWNLIKHGPIVPFLYLQSKYIRKTMPDIPPAHLDLDGSIEGYTEWIHTAFIGESTIAGVGAESHRQALAGRVCNRLSNHYNKNVSWQVEGHIGYTKKKIVEEVIHKVPLHDKDIIIVAMGGNDSFVLTSPQQWYTYTRRLIDHIHSCSRAKVVFASMPPTHMFPSFNRPMRSFIGRQTDILRESLIDVVSAYDSDVTFVDKKVDFREYVKRWNDDITMEDLFCDGYHPSTITYDIWAEDIAKHITNTFNIFS